ncbi:fructokinase [Synechococcus sp. CCY9201]|nr:fructokinase [Synechococcus sp. CCY9201]
MTFSRTFTRMIQVDRHTSMFDLFQALRDDSTPNTPAAFTEALMPEIKQSFWLLVSSNTVIDSQDTQVLPMILERAVPSGVSVALNVDWQPQLWGLPPHSPPSSEVLRRVQPLIWAAQLIHCTGEEAEMFFGTTDPVRLHNGLPQRPAVLIMDSAGDLQWCIGGLRGRLDFSMLQDHEVFLARLLDNLSTNPQLLGHAGPGVDAVADPDGLAEQLLTAAAASAGPSLIHNKGLFIDH